MANLEDLLFIISVVLCSGIYGLKWGILIGITLFLSKLIFDSKNNNNIVKNQEEFMENNITFTEHESYEYNYERDTLIEPSQNGTLLSRDETYERNMRRGKLHNDTLPFHREPLLCQVTKRLSFNNSSYIYPEIATSPHLQPNITAKGYNPEKLIYQSPQRRINYDTSKVKISRPSDSKYDSRFALESLLHKRFERTKDPCSCQSVVTALDERSSRKRNRQDSDNLMVDSYPVGKKSRRDDLDEFLEVVNNPLKRSPVMKTIKRPYSGSQTPSTQTITKKMKENETRKKPSPPLNSFEDSGVDVNSPIKPSQNPIVQENKLTSIKARKRKSVSFSDKLIDEHLPENAIKKEKVSHHNLNEKDSTKDKEVNENVFRITFSPRKSLSPNYLSSLSERVEKKNSSRHRSRGNITWKDIQESRREAWKRSQKLLDDIEESFRKENIPKISEKLSDSQAKSVTSNVTSEVPSSFSSNIAGNQQDKINPLTGISTQTSQGSTSSSTSFTTTLKNTQLQSGISNDSAGITRPSSGIKSYTALFGGTVEPTSVSFVPSLVSNPSPFLNTSTSQQVLGTQVIPTSSSTSNTSSSLNLHSTTDTNKNINAITTEALVNKSTTVGLNSFTSGFNADQSQTSIKPTVGFSFPLSTVNQTNLKNDVTFKAPAFSGTNVSGGPTLMSQPKQPSEKSSTPKFSFTLPAVSNPSNVTSFSSTAAPVKQKDNVGFTFTLSNSSFTNKPINSGGFTFSAPVVSETQKSSSNFNFIAPTTTNSSNGFQPNLFTGTNANNNVNFSSFASHTPGELGNSTTTVKNPSSFSGGFNFGNQTTPATFNFGSPAGGFNLSGGFTSSTPIQTNSNKSNNLSAKARQQRRKGRK